MILAGNAINEMDERGNSIIDDTMLMLINPHWEPIPFVMPHPKILGTIGGIRRELGPGTGYSDIQRQTRYGATLKPGETYQTESRSFAVFRFNAAP